MLPVYKQETTLRLTGATAQLDVVRRMVDGDAGCTDLMHQLASAQGTLAGEQAVVFHDDLARCIATARESGRCDTSVDEMVSALTYNRGLIGGRGAGGPERSEAVAVRAARGAPCGAPRCPTGEC